MEKHNKLLLLTLLCFSAHVLLQGCTLSSVMRATSPWETIMDTFLPPPHPPPPQKKKKKRKKDMGKHQSGFVPSCAAACFCEKNATVSDNTKIRRLGLLSLKRNRVKVIHPSAKHRGGGHRLQTAPWERFPWRRQRTERAIGAHACILIRSEVADMPYLRALSISDIFI